MRAPLPFALATLACAALLPGAALAEVTGIAAGRAHTCAITGDGDLTCWGDNARGQLGQAGEGLPSGALVDNARFVREVAAGDAFTCLLHRSGRVRCFGANDTGQLGDESSRDRPRPGPVALANARAVAAGDVHACAVTSDGKVRCWGEDRYGQVGAAGTALYVTRPSVVTGVDGVEALALGTSHSCALVSGGRVRCWGGDYAGQRGDGDARRSEPSFVVGLEEVRALSSGAHHACALRGDEVLCWGAAAGGKLGDGVRDDQHAPVVVPELAGAREIAAGGTFTCALVDEGLRCLGGPFGPRRDLPASGAAHLVAGHAHACFVDAGGVRCVGSASAAQLGDGRRGGLSSARPLPVPGLDDAVRLAASRARTCVLRSNAEVSCWGAGRPAPERVADGTFVDVVLAGGAVAGRHEGDALLLLEEDALSTRAHLAAASALDLAAGRAHACAVSTDGAVFCWGRDEAGQLGDGRRRKGSAKKAQGPARVRALRGVLEVGAGAAHTCALGRDGAVWCWGSHVLGELGVPSKRGHDEPVRVAIPPAAELEVGAHHTCAREDTGGVWCWGAGKQGELGDGTRRGSRYPVRVSGLDDAVALALGAQHACAVRVDGEVACWGAGESGQLGDGARASRASPVVVPGLSAVVEVVAGERHTCARDEGGRVSCWGAGDEGQLGQGAPLVVETPVAVQLP